MAQVPAGSKVFGLETCSESSLGFVIKVEAVSLLIAQAISLSQLSDRPFSMSIMRFSKRKATSRFTALVDVLITLLCHPKQPRRLT